ncbi:hypothetical protein M5D96_002671 [Drosophila gunungcola]|uniref:Uncharacterized protein n=1 Tax=Drosophila gunungcola TaxID=103775 RepID=A0A9Q0BW67_9MUSC|nr:hypothetical protein M5D96_002671 [Drosophila gunungcola]
MRNYLDRKPAVIAARDEIRRRLTCKCKPNQAKPNKTRSRAQKLMEMQEENRTEIAPDKNKQNAAD